MAGRSNRFAWLGVGYALVVLATCGGMVTAAAQSAEPATVERRLPFGPAEAILLRSTLIGTNLSNATGEYALLRGLMAPETAAALPVEALAALFAPWRAKQRDFGFAAIADAELSEPPSLSPDGELRLAGEVPTPSFKLAFELVYVKPSSRWLLKRFSFSDGTIAIRSTDLPAVAQARKTAPPARSLAVPVTTTDRIPPLPPTRPWY